MARGPLSDSRVVTLRRKESQKGKGEPFQREPNSSLLKWLVSDAQVVFPLPNYCQFLHPSFGKFTTLAGRVSSWGKELLEWGRRFSAISLPLKNVNELLVIFNWPA